MLILHPFSCCLLFFLTIGLVIGVRNIKKLPQGSKGRRAWSSALGLITLLVFVFWFLLTHSYHLEIQRDFASEEEQEAIRVAEEEFDYEHLFMVGAVDGDAWKRKPFFIDGNSIETHADRVEEKRKTLASVHISFEYHATVQVLENSSVRLSGEQDTWENRTVWLPGEWELLENNLSQISGELGIGRKEAFLIWNGSAYWRNTPEELFDFGGNRTYLVRMESDYDHTYGFLGGRYTHIIQYVLLDSEYQLLMVALEWSDSVA
jgi:hypothetical protein